MRQSSKLVISLLGAVFMIGCPGDPTPPSTPPTIVSFFASSTSLPIGGGNVSLSWTESDATALSIDSGVGDVTGRSSVSVHVTQTTTFTLTAENQLGSAEAAVTVTVQVPTAPPTIVGFTANPSTLAVGGGSTTLLWSVNDATDIFISNVGDETGKSQTSVSLSATTTYTLTASNSLGSNSATVTVTVQQPTSPPTISSFSASQSSLPMGGGTVTLSWNVSQATSLSISGIGAVTGTSKTVNVTQTTTFVLTASNSLGNSEASTTVTVYVPTAPPTISAFNTSSTLLGIGGGTVTLSWSVNNASTISISPNVGTVTGKTSVNVNVTQTTTFTLTATNSVGPASQSLTVTVEVPTSPPTINAFQSSSQELQGSGTVTLSWSVSNATSLSISPSVGSVTGKSSVNVNVAETTTFTLTASNSVGNNTAETTVTVTPNAPVISSFNASTTSLAYGGGDVTFSWSVQNANSLSLTDVGTVTGTSYTLFVAQTTTFYLSASNGGGTTESSPITVSVAQGQAPVISSFSASPDEITAGGDTTLFYSVSGASTLSIDHGIGSVFGTSQEIEIPSSGPWTFTLTASNSYGQTQATCTVYVDAEVSPPVINTFTASPSEIDSGNKTTLSWNVTGATSYEINNSAVSGTSILEAPTTTTTYTLTASNSGGSSTANVTVTVDQGFANAPTINSFSAPSTATAGSPFEFTWSVSDAQDLQITANVGSSPGDCTGLSSLSYTENTSGTYKFTLTASNNAGSSQATATVVVSAASKPVISTFTVNGSSSVTINAGQDVTLAWTVSGASDITIDNGVGDVTGTSSKSEFIATSGTHIFTLTATSAAGGVSTAKVTVIAQ